MFLLLGCAMSDVMSCRYLKKRVLPALEGQLVIKKIHTKRTLTPAEIEQRMQTTSKKTRKKRQEASPGMPVDAWLWQLRTGQLPKKQKTPETKPFGWEVGVGEDL